MHEHDTPSPWRRSWCPICRTHFEWFPSSDRSRSICDDCRTSDAVKAIDRTASKRVDALVLGRGMSWDAAILKVRAEQERRAETLARRQTAQSWSVIRRRIYERDGGVCQVCGVDVPGYWECGHKIDRSCGGSDLDDNLVVMCVSCNRIKPGHHTIEEYNAWAARGGLAEIVRRVLDGEYP